MRDAIAAFLLGFPALFSIVNPISGAFIFREVTAHRLPADRALLARRVAIYSLVVMMVALTAESYVLAFFGISLAALALTVRITYGSVDRVDRFMGPAGSRTVTRLAAFLLLCVGVQILITGVEDVLTPLLVLDRNC